MLEAPKVRRDGKCYVCKGERRFNYQRGVPRWAYTKDPFCSSVCARKFFGTDIKVPTSTSSDPAKHRGLGIKLGSKTKQAKYA